MCEVYRFFGKDWTSCDFSDEAMVELFNAESHGAPCSPRNGFLVGKRWLSVTIAAWKEDILLGNLFLDELYTDRELPNWWLDSIFKKK
jgi:hypothetical protein